MNTFKEKAIKYVFLSLAFASLFFLVGICFVLVKESIPAIREITLLDFLFGLDWYPTYSPPEYGILPLILGTLSVSFVAIIICVPLGLGTALYIYEIAPNGQKKILRPIIEILSSIPSIVFGFFGMVVLAPFLQKVFNLPVGLCLLAAGLILAMLAIPVVVSMSLDALNAVPRSFREASYALGGTRWQTLVKVIIPAAGSGISTAIILAISRLIGETMTVLMVAGGAAIIPTSLFSPVRPMTAVIAGEMGEAAQGSLHYSSLFFIGLVLFLMTLLLNILAENISKKYRLKLGLGR